MHTWDQVQALVQSGELQCLQRTPEMTEKYRRYKAQLEAEGTTIVDVIVERRLEWSRSELSELAARYVTVEQRTNAMLSAPELFKLLPNDFAYDLAPGLYHLVVWSKIAIPLYVSHASREQRPHVHDKIERFVKTNLARFGVHDYVWFINYPHLQSVKSVSHVHVMLRAESSEVIERMLREQLVPCGEDHANGAGARRVQADGLAAQA
ncbi:LAFE_0G13850g1_1 [Lachancea fermentati]|uniref:LAFE_0G13850g1_1 n=1 Tax=Lachancea fermentati TaxID=4955 RepID=A0A1G4MI63_LACFM|nr:LAFE_0G13850g1_1 [Lachancea fermentati]